MTKLEAANKILARKSTIGCKTSVKEINTLISRDLNEVLEVLDTIYSVYDNINEMPEELYDILMELRRHVANYVNLVIDNNKITSMKRALQIMKDDEKIL